MEDEIDSTTANVALLLDKEIDKRVLLSLLRLLSPDPEKEAAKLENEVENAITNPFVFSTSYVVCSHLIVALMRDPPILHDLLKAVVDNTTTHNSRMLQTLLDKVHLTIT